MKKEIYILYFFAFIINSVFGQYTLKNSEDVNWYSNISQEEIVVQTNSEEYLVGETIYYHIYCLNANTRTFSKNSKIAYVKLVSKNGTISEHKVKLENGYGYSHLNLPANIATGHYKLLGYTQWMLNSTGNLFQLDLAIINPYSEIKFRDFQTPLVRPPKQSKLKELFAINLNKENYKPREKIELRIRGLNAVSNSGAYSISVLKKPSAHFSNLKIRSEVSNYVMPVNDKRETGETIYLPEFKGEMISGKVNNKNTGLPLANIEVALSVLSPEAYQDIVKTNKDGVFFFQIGQNYKVPKALLQVIGEDRTNYEIKIQKQPQPDISKLAFRDLHVNASMEEEIINRSITNQIQNAFKEVSPKTISIEEYPKSFFGNPRTTYRLNDYRRFNTIGETLTEIVDNAWHERKKGKTRYINVRALENSPYYLEDIMPLVVVDGGIVQDHEKLINHEAKDVESITVLRDEYYYGGKVFQGVLAISTFGNNFNHDTGESYKKVIDLYKPQYSVQYATTLYNPEVKDLDRVPDTRTQLYWTPNVPLNNLEQKQIFFASDELGEFEIVIRGVTSYGVSFNFSKTFKVEER